MLRAVLGQMFMSEYRAGVSHIIIAKISDGRQWSLRTLCVLINFRYLKNRKTEFRISYPFKYRDTYIIISNFFFVQFCRNTLVRPSNCTDHSSVYGFCFCHFSLLSNPMIYRPFLRRPNTPKKYSSTVCCTIFSVTD